MDNNFQIEHVIVPCQYRVLIQRVKYMGGHGTCPYKSLWSLYSEKLNLRSSKTRCWVIYHHRRRSRYVLPDVALWDPLDSGSAVLTGCSSYRKASEDDLFCTRPRDYLLGTDLSVFLEVVHEGEVHRLQRDEGILIAKAMDEASPTQSRSNTRAAS